MKIITKDRPCLDCKGPDCKDCSGKGFTKQTTIILNPRDLLPLSEDVKYVDQR